MFETYSKRGNVFGGKSTIRDVALQGKFVYFQKSQMRKSLLGNLRIQKFIENENRRIVLYFIFAFHLDLKHKLII